jgi:solute carrier family 35 protein E1
VLSRATTFSSLPRLNKLHREHLATNASLLSVKSIGSVSDGGNLVWGRQLRPELCSPALKKGAVLLRPCLAAAEGKDSAG